LERYPSGFESVSARIEFLVRIVGEGFRPSSCLVLGTTIPSFIPMVVPDSLGSWRDFIDDSKGQSCWQRFETTAVVLILT